MKSLERIESLLITIDRLGMATVEHLRNCHDLKSQRNAYTVLKQLEPYTNTTYLHRKKIFYLNKKGREMIGSEKEIDKNRNMKHMLLRNDVYLALNKPITWEVEKVLEFEKNANMSKLDVIIKGLNVTDKKKIQADAFFTRNGYTYYVEVDNLMSMMENHKKIVNYGEFMAKDKTARLLIFTHTLERKRKFEKWMITYKIKGECKLYDEVKM